MSSTVNTGGRGNTISPPPKRSRSWVFTLNNWSAAEVEAIKALDSMKYMVVGYETGAEGTPHLQGTIQYNHGRTFELVKKDLPRAHIEPCMNLLKSIEYCKKEDNFFELGVAPTDGGETEKSRWTQALEQARNYGECEDDQIQFKHARLIEYHHMKHMAKQPSTEQTEYKHIWIYGATGTGKTRWIYDNVKTFYEKLKNKWWDGYDNHEYVVIDEFDIADAWLSTYMKRWCDRYAFSGEVKGGMKVGIRPKIIFVTSNYSMEQIWPDEQTRAPLARRFTQVYVPDQWEILEEITYLPRAREVSMGCVANAPPI